MSTRTVEQIDSWDTVPFSGGYSGLHDLADSQFSGAVIAGPTRLFMLNGNVVGILDGSLDDFEDADGTAREAPHSSLPLLAVMQERSDEVRAKYYTEDTPVSEVDETLSNGGFTGFVELSENVLSGDYYQIYHQGRSMSVAWVGNNDQLLTDDEAFERADDEVGIYEVRPVEIDIVEIPEPAGADESGATGAVAGSTEPPAAGETQSADDGGEPTTTDEPDQSDRTAETGGTDPVAKTGSETATRQATDTGASGTAERASRSEESTAEDTGPQADDGATAEAQSSEQSRTADSPPETDAPSPQREQGEPRHDASVTQPEGERSTEPAERGRQGSTDHRQSSPQERVGGTTETRSEPRSTQPRDRRDQPSQTEPAPAGESARTDAGQPSPDSSNVAPAPHDPSAGGATDLETRSIPSLDPSHSATASTSAATEEADSEPDAGERREGQPQSSPEQSGRQRERDDPRSQQGHPGAPPEERGEPVEQQDRPARDEPAAQAPARQESSRAERRPDPGRIDELETALEESESERERLEAELDSLRDERDELQSDLEAARTEIESLEQRLEEMATDDDTPDADTRLSQREAIDQTNLFVRYNSKGDATLEAVHSGNAGRSEVDDNLRLEFHTQFDADSAAVGNQAFETFLTESIQYRFVDWLVRNLLYEIRDTGNPEAMKELYNALPKIDRAELNGAVSVEYTEEGETHRSQEQFDVVVRDRMGNPLIVANINNSRDPATDDMMTDLITRAERVGSSSESLAGAFLVTESFFEPPALETAEEATSSGLLSRDKRKSFVNLTRKDGYHLCLVEARNQEFHLAVPEL